MRVLYGEQDISWCVTGIVWSGSRSQVARKLEIKVLNAPTDANIIPPTLELAEPIYLFDDNDKELFRGFITDRQASSAVGEITYTAYDMLFYTLKSSATYNFSGKTAEGIAKMVCDDVEIPTGELASTGISQKLIVQGVSIYEIIMQAYTQAHQQNGVSYRVTAKEGAVCVEEMGKVVCTIDLSDERNLLSSKYTETLSNMVNKVRIYDGEGNPAGVVQNDEDLKYGIFQQVYTKEEGKDPTTTAKSKFKGVEKTFELSCLNYNECVTGSGVEIRDTATGLSGLVWIDADTHTWQNGVATMDLTVTLKYIMDTKDFTVEKSGSKLDDGGGGGGGGGGGTASKTGSRDNPPFKVYEPVEYEGYRFYDEFEQWEDVVYNLIDRNWLADGYIVYDKDGNEIDMLLPTDSWYTRLSDPKNNPPFYRVFSADGNVNTAVMFATLEELFSNYLSLAVVTEGGYVVDADYRYIPLTYEDALKIPALKRFGSKNDAPFRVVYGNEILAEGFLNYILASNFRNAKAEELGVPVSYLRIEDKNGRLVWNYAVK